MPRWLDDLALAVGEEELRRILLTALEAGDFEIGMRDEVAAILRSGKPRGARTR